MRLGESLWGGSPFICPNTVLEEQCQDSTLVRHLLHDILEVPNADAGHILTELQYTKDVAGQTGDNAATERSPVALYGPIPVASDFAGARVAEIYSGQIILYLPSNPRERERSLI